MTGALTATATAISKAATVKNNNFFLTTLADAATESSMFVTTATIEPPSYVQAPKFDDRFNFVNTSKCDHGSPSPSSSTALAKFNKIIDETMPTTNYYNYCNIYNSATTSSLSSALLSKQISLAVSPSFVKSSICTVQPRLSVTTTSTSNGNKKLFNDVKKFDRKFSGNMDILYNNTDSNLSINLKKTLSSDNQTKRNDVHYLLKQLNSFSDIEEIAIVDIKNTTISNASMLSNTSPLTTVAQRESSTLSSSSSLLNTPAGQAFPFSLTSPKSSKLLKETPSTSTLSLISSSSTVSQTKTTTINLVNKSQSPQSTTISKLDKFKSTITAITTTTTPTTTTTTTTTTTKPSSSTSTTAPNKIDEQKFKYPSFRQKSTIKSCHNSKKQKTVFEIELSSNSFCKEPITTMTTSYTTTCVTADKTTSKSVLSSTKNPKQKTQITTATTSPQYSGGSEKHNSIYGHHHTHEFRLTSTSSFTKKQQQFAGDSGESPSTSRLPGAVTTVVYSTTTRMSGDVIQTEIIRSCDSPSASSGSSNLTTGSNNSSNKRSKSNSKNSGASGFQTGITTSISISNSYMIQDETTKTSSFFKCCYTPLDRWRERRNSNTAAATSSNNNINGSNTVNGLTTVVTTVVNSSPNLVTCQSSLTTTLSGISSTATITTVASNINNSNNISNNETGNSNNSNSSSNAPIALTANKNTSNLSVHGDAV